jgi:hypothetical protein
MMQLKALAAAGLALSLLGGAIQPAAAQTPQSEVTIKVGNCGGQCAVRPFH